MSSMKYNDLINETLNKNKLVKINDKLYLTAYQIEVLEKYQIPYQTCNRVGEIIFYIEDILNEDANDLEDLESISSALSEMDYYANYKK